MKYFYLIIILCSQLTLLGQKKLNEAIKKIEQSESNLDVAESLLTLTKENYKEFPDTVLYFIDKYYAKVDENSFEYAKIKSFWSSIYFRSRDYDRFLEMSKAVVQLTKDKPEPFIQLYYYSIINIGLAHKKKGEVEEAEKKYLEVIEKTSERYDSIAAKGMSNMASLKAMEGDFIETEKWARSAAKIFRKYGSDNRLLSVLNNLAIALNEQGHFNDAKEIYLSIIKLAEKLEHHHAKAIFTHNLGTSYRELNNFDSAVYYYNLSYELKKEHHPNGIPLLLNDYANLYRSLLQLNKAIELYKEAVVLNTNLNEGAVIYNYYNIAQCYLDLNELALAHKYTEKMLEKAISLGYKQNEGQGNMLSAKIYLKEGNLKKAKEKATKAKNMMVFGNAAAMDFTLITALGTIENEVGNHKAALQSFRSIQGNRITDFNQNIVLNLGLSESFYGLGNFDSGKYYTNVALALKDSVFLNFNTKNVEEAKAKFETDLAEVKKEVAIQKVEKQRNIKLFFISLFVLSVLFIFLLVSRHKKFIKEKEAKRKVEKEKILKQVEHSKEVLVNQSNLIKDKNRIINELKDFLGKYTSEVMGKDAGEMANTILENKILTKEDWINFKTYFSTLFPGYVQNVLTKFPSITESEERYLYLRKLEFNNKDMADMLGVLPRSINKTKSRFLIKYNLKDEIALDLKLQFNDEEE